MLKLLSTTLRQLQRGALNTHPAQTIVIRRYQKLGEDDDLDFKSLQRDNPDYRDNTRSNNNFTESYSSGYSRNSRPQYNRNSRSEYNRPRYSPQNEFQTGYNRNRNNSFRSDNEFSRDLEQPDFRSRGTQISLTSDTVFDSESASEAPFEKGTFTLSTSVTERSQEEVDAYREENNIEIYSNVDDVPNPIQTFEDANFNPMIMEYLREQQWDRPTAIQAQAWSIALMDKNLVAISPTGSGKTLAYILPALEHIQRQKAHISKSNTRITTYKPIVLVVTPTRELARQVHSVVRTVKPRDVSSACMHGGQSDRWYYDHARIGLDICVSTIGRLLDNLNNGMIDLSYCTYMVVDEADEMLKGEFEKALRQIFMASRPDKQILMFTATWNDTVASLADEFLPERVHINIDNTTEIKSSIKQTFVVCPTFQKMKRLEQIVRDIRNTDSTGKIIVFANTVKSVDYLWYRLSSMSANIYKLHGHLTQAQRNKITSAFRLGQGSILIATDVAARGLDIEGVDHIINFNFPTTLDMYIHRIGRCGRQGVQGTTYTFVGIEDIRMVKPLIEFLERRNHEVDEALIKLVQSSRDYSR